MPSPLGSILPCVFIFLPIQTFAQNQCYYDAGAKGPSNLVPCNPSGQSACCLLGDICLSGNACYDYTTGDTYQYGCTDSSFQDSTCPYKCGWDTSRSPYTTLIYCSDIPDPNNNSQNISNTWVCLSPESCGCNWGPSDQSLHSLPPRDCKDMGDQARVALSAPSVLAPWVSLPTSNGGSTGYFRGTTIGGTSSWAGPIPGYSPNPLRELTDYQDGPSQVVIAGGRTVTSASSTLSTSSTSRTSSTSSTSSTVAPGMSSSATSTVIKSSSTSPKSSTMPITTSPSSTALSTTDSSPATASSSQTPSISSSPAVAGDGGLSTGEKAGIGIGAAAAILLLAGLVFLIWRRRHRRTDRTEGMSQHMPFYVPPQPEQPMQQAALPSYTGNPQADNTSAASQRGTDTPRTPPQKMHASVYTESPGYGGQSMMYARAEDLSQRSHDLRSLHSTRGPPTPSPAYEDATRQS